jgi:hypothetical protein
LPRRDRPVSPEILFADAQKRAFLPDRTYLRRITFLLDRFATGEDPILYKAPAIIFVHSRQLIPTPREDSILAAYKIVLAAECLGLGSRFVPLAQNAINSSRAMKEIVAMDPREQVYTVVAVHTGLLPVGQVLEVGVLLLGVDPSLLEEPFGPVGMGIP